MPRISLVLLALIVSGCNCGTGAGDPAPCLAPPPACESGQVSAVEVFSRRGCVSAVTNHWCGVKAQELAQCLADAQMCLQRWTTQEQINTALAASACAAQFEAWDTCFANGEAEGDGDDDWDD